MIIGLAGYARSGKDEVAKVLVEKYGFKRVAFADPIREFAQRVNPILTSGTRLNEMIHEFGWNIAKSNNETRRLLQEIGVTARDMFGPNFWVDIALRNMSIYSENIVISDVRFKNEIAAIKQLNGQVWRVIRQGVGPVNDHISEKDIDSAYFDAYIANDGTLKELEEYVSYLVDRDADKII